MTAEPHPPAFSYLEHKLGCGQSGKPRMLVPSTVPRPGLWLPASRHLQAAVGTTSKANAD